MPRTLIRAENGIELWQITHDVDPTKEAFIVKDPTRTPEDWGYASRADAKAKFEQRLAYAEARPPLLRR